MLIHTIIRFTSMLGKIIRIKRGREEDSRETFVVEAPEKRVATMDAVNSELRRMTLKEGVNETTRPPRFELKMAVMNRYRYKRIETTTNADFEDWCREKLENTTPEKDMHSSPDGAGLRIYYHTNIANYLEV